VSKIASLFRHVDIAAIRIEKTSSQNRKEGSRIGAKRGEFILSKENDVSTVRIDEKDCRTFRSGPLIGRKREMRSEEPRNIE